jgi:hypothetical protein
MLNVPSQGHHGQKRPDAASDATAFPVPSTLRTLEEATFDEAKVRALAAQNTQLMTELIVQKARIKNSFSGADTRTSQMASSRTGTKRARRYARTRRHRQPSNNWRGRDTSPRFLSATMDERRVAKWRV